MNVFELITGMVDCMNRLRRLDMHADGTVRLTEPEMDRLLTSDKVLFGVARDLNNPGPAAATPPNDNGSSSGGAGPVQTTDPLALDNRAAAPVSAGPVNLPPMGPRGLEEAGIPITCPASSPVCRFGQGEYQRGWDGGPIL